MFNQEIPWGFLRINADHSYAQRVFALYLNRQQDDLLGFGYHQYKQRGRGLVRLSCGYLDLFFGKGFHPTKAYTGIDNPQIRDPDVTDAIATYNPETEIVIQLTVQNSELNCLSRLSKRGLALSVIHRQYLDRFLDYLSTPDVVSS